MNIIYKMHTSAIISSLSSSNIQTCDSSLDTWNIYHNNVYKGLTAANILEEKFSKPVNCNHLMIYCK